MGVAFGAAVSISDSVAVIGAYLDDIVGSDSGSAYVFSVIPEPASMVLLSTAATWLSLFIARTVDADSLFVAFPKPRTRRHLPE